MIEVIWFYGEPYRIPSCWTVVLIQGRILRRVDRCQWVRF